MKSIVKNKKFLVIFLIALTVVSIIIGIVTVNQQKKNATIIIQFAPKSARAFINHKQARETNRVAPGEYTITVTRDGFDSYEEKISLTKDSERIIYAVLTPNTDETRFWYENNKEDANLRERIFFRDFSTGSEDAEKKFPIMKDLPFIGPKRIYRIDYGKGSKEGTQALYITYYSSDAKQMALDWIKEKGYSIEDYEIFYKELDINDL